MTEPKRHLTKQQQAEVLKGVIDAEKWREQHSRLREEPPTNGATPTTETFRVYTAGELLEFPEPEWLVEPFITDGAITILYGASGTFKSFVALSWAGQAPGHALYISAEGSPKRLGERIHAYEHETKQPSNILTIPHAVNLLHEADQFTATLDALPIPPRLLVVDTAARNMAGHDENSTKDMSSLVGVLDEIRFKYQLAVVIIHHSGHENTDRERGSSALRGAADISVHAKRGDTPLTVKLRCAKSRDTAEFEPCTIRLEPIQTTLVAGRPASTIDNIQRDVDDYLQATPTASMRDTIKAVTGNDHLIRSAYHKARNTHQQPQ